MTPEQIAGSLKGRTTLFRDEVRLHAQMAAAFLRAGFVFSQEVKVARGRLDFLFADGTALEVKVKGSGTAVFRQVTKYLEIPEIQSVIVVSTKAMTLPMRQWVTAGGIVKPVYLVELWRNAF